MHAVFKSDSLSQVIAEYCLDHPEDSGCKLVLPHLIATVGEEVALHVHLAMPVDRVTAKIVHSSCACDDEHCEMVREAKVEYTEAFSGIVTVSATPFYEGSFTICVVDYGPDRVVTFKPFASVDATPRSCEFSDGLEGSPCAADACAEDPTSDECMQLTAEYCVLYPEDSGCSLVMPLFRRIAGSPASVEAHARAAYAGAEITVIASRYACGDLEAVAASPVTILDSALIGSVESVTFVAPSGVVGRYSICVGGMAAAAVEFVQSKCLFTVADSPCEEPACLTDPLSDACAQVTHEFCAANPEELACGLLVPTFLRDVGVVTRVMFAAPSVLASHAAIRVSQASCGCAPECGGDVGVEILSLQFLVGAPIVLDFVPHEPGDYSVCAAPVGLGFLEDFPVLLTNIKVKEPAGCVFAEFAAPCEAPSCLADPYSAECMQVT